MLHILKRIIKQLNVKKKNMLYILNDKKNMLFSTLNMDFASRSKPLKITISISPGQILLRLRWDPPSTRHTLFC